uniref:Uncharacterized protein n=1 Tax=Rhizophora mucronata TaxID=61149 RepID=A0A2P2J248_RHIMU
MGFWVLVDNSVWELRMLKGK